MSHYTVTVIHNDRMVQVYPQKRESGTSFEDTCKRIGMMVMAENVEAVMVYRDGEIYRKFLRREEEKA